ncbi:MAG: hypothetical protein ABI857_03685 [Acidobacteriota bacterium]
MTEGTGSISSALAVSYRRHPEADSQEQIYDEQQRRGCGNADRGRGAPH